MFANFSENVGSVEACKISNAKLITKDARNTLITMILLNIFNMEKVQNLMFTCSYTVTKSS